jgi:hypothetical protein
MKGTILTVVIVIIAIGSFIGMGSFASFAWDKYKEAQEQAATSKLYAEETAKTMENFGLMVAEEMENYSKDIDVLQQAFTFSYNDEQEFNTKVDKHDYNKLAVEKPRILERVINNEFKRLHDEIRQVTGYTATDNAGTTETTKTVTSKPATR